MDLTKIVPSKEDREAFWVLQQARDAAETAYEDAKSDLPDNDAHDDEATKLRRAHRDGAFDYNELHQKLNALNKAENDRVDALPEIASLKAAYDAAEKLWDDHPAESGVWTNYESKPYRCAASGAIMLEDDEYLEDDDTNEYVLRALILPPRHPEEDEAEEDDDEDEPKIAAA